VLKRGRRTPLETPSRHALRRRAPRASPSPARDEQPKVLFADEPTGNLDAETGKQIMSVFEGIASTSRRS
jgi:ABC-type arginine transport system ATPase subunit